MEISAPQVVEFQAKNPDERSPVGHILKTTGIENGVYAIQFALSPKAFYPEYPENANSLGEAIRKARIDRGLMIRELAELVGADEMTVVNWELKDRQPKSKFHKRLQRVLDIELGF